MSDLISRQAAIEALKKYEELESDNFSNTDPVVMMTVGTIANCIEEIVNLPPVKSKQKKGTWMITYYDWEKAKEMEIPLDRTAFDRPEGQVWCSECEYDALLDGREEYVFSSYCPHCGADMRDE